MFKIRASLTTSKEGLQKLTCFWNVKEKYLDFNGQIEQSL